MKPLLLCCIGVLLASTSILRAQRVEISPFYGCRFGGEVQDSTTGETFSFQAGPAYGLFLDLGPTNSEMKIELMWSRQESQVDFRGEYGLDKVNLTIDQIQIGGVAELGGDGRFREYLSALAGVTYFSSEGFESSVKFSLGIGVGARFFLFRHVALRADLHGFCTVVEGQGSFMYHDGVTVATFSGSSLWQGQATVGVSITF